MLDGAAWGLVSHRSVSEENLWMKYMMLLLLGLDPLD